MPLSLFYTQKVKNDQKLKIEGGPCLKAFALQMRPKPGEIAAKTSGFRHRRKALKVIRSITAVSAQRGHETAGVRSLFLCLSFQISMK